MRQVAVIVGQLAVHAVDHGLMGEVAVVAERDLAEHEIAHLIEAVFFHQFDRVDDVAERFRYFLTLVGPPAVGEDVPGRRQPRAHQERRPIDGVEAQDVLADHVQVGRPEGRVFTAIGFRKTDAGDVVGQGVQPHVHDVIFVARHRHPPFEGGAGNREVLKPTGNEADDFVAARLGEDEIRVGVVEFQQSVLPRRKPEEIAWLLHPFDLGPRGRDLIAVGVRDQLVPGVESLVTDGVPAGIGVEVDLAVIDQAAPNSLA